MSVLAITQRESLTGLALPLAAMFVVAMGYGVALPVLPFVPTGALVEAARAAVAWHTGLLTGVYMLALFLFAPLWGYVSDRIGRRAVILLGLAGFSVAMLWFPLARGLVFVYGARVLAGVFAAAVLPVVLAWVSDMGTSRTRARMFAWLSAASALGFLFGPALSGWLASIEFVAQDDALALPFYAVALLGGMVWLAAYRFLPERAPPRARDSEPERSVPSLAERSVPSLIWLLALSLLVMFGIGSFEVGVALRGQQALNLQPREIGWIFAECSLVMILAQVFLLAPLMRRVGDRLLAPAFLAMAVGIALLPYAASYPAMLIGVGLVAAAAGLLIPALAYLVSLTAGSAQGAALGQQTARELRPGRGLGRCRLAVRAYPGRAFLVIASVLAAGIGLARAPVLQASASRGKVPPPQVFGHGPGNKASSARRPNEQANRETEGSRTTMSTLVFNSRSASLKFGLFDPCDELAALVRGTVTGFGAQTTSDRTFRDAHRRETPAARDHAQAAQAVLARPDIGARMLATGYRVVHGREQRRGRDDASARRGASAFARGAGLRRGCLPPCARPAPGPEDAACTVCIGRW